MIICKKKWKNPIDINTEDKFNEYEGILGQVFELFESAVINDINVIDDAIELLDSIDDKNIDKNYLNKLKDKAISNKI